MSTLFAPKSGVRCNVSDGNETWDEVFDWPDLPAARARQVARAAAAGATVGEISERLGLSRERVRQLVEAGRRAGEFASKGRGVPIEAQERLDGHLILWAQLNADAVAAKGLWATARCDPAARALIAAELVDDLVGELKRAADDLEGWANSGATCGVADTRETLRSIRETIARVEAMA